jgi:hypothetical protein
MQHFLPPQPHEILIPDFSVKPADDVDLNLHISSELSFTTNSANPNKKMFQLPILKNRTTNSQPAKDLSMETLHNSNEQPKSENEFLPNNEEEDVWNQKDKR